jgi:hypothetical protein
MIRVTHLLMMIGFSVTLLVTAQTLPPLNDGEPHGDPPFLLEGGWTPLLNGKDLRGWHSREGKTFEWFTTRGVYWDPVVNPRRLFAVPGTGDRILNGPKGNTADVITDAKFGDAELYLEFLLPQSSNSGVYLHALYEVQILDSFGKVPPLGWEDCGGLPKEQTEGKGFEGAPPLRNASRKPGDWQSYHIWFRAPRFDSSGRKIGHAVFLRVLHNGLLVQENVEVSGPTLAHLNIPEASVNPLMLQGDHGPVAYRNIYIRPLRPMVKR